MAGSLRVAFVRRRHSVWRSPLGPCAMVKAWKNSISLMNSSASMGHVVSNRRSKRGPKTKGGLSQKRRPTTCESSLLGRMNWLLQTVSLVEAGQICRLIQRTAYTQTAHLKHRKDVLFGHSKKLVSTQVSPLVTQVEHCWPLVSRPSFQRATSLYQYLRSIEQNKTRSHSLGNSPNWPIEKHCMNHSRIEKCETILIALRPSPRDPINKIFSIGCTELRKHTIAALPTP